MAEKEYIERGALIADVCERCRGVREPCDSIHCLMLEVIYQVPAADVRPVVRGRWIETKTGFHCSACKTKAKGTKDGALLSNFCPNCGADMRPTSMSGANGEES